MLRDVASEAQDEGLRMMIQVDREDRRPPRRLAADRSTTRSTTPSASGRSPPIYGQANQYRVILEAMPQYQLDPTSLSKLYVPASGNQAVAQSTSLTAGTAAEPSRRRRQAARRCR